MIKIKSKVAYTKGTILHDESTSENYEVIKCDRIAIMNDTPQYGLTLKVITSQSIYID